jgi:ribonucleotide reductase beta subunit family protein with ferritin-like domain
LHESLHPGFGVDLVNQVRAETDAWTADFESEIVGLIREAVEDDPALRPRAAMPSGIGFKRYISPVISSGMEASRLTVPGRTSTS